jgi:hypothetical protein
MAGHKKKARLISVLTLEIARTKVDYELTAPLPEYRGIRLRRAVPINNDLNEQSFLDYLASLDNAIVLATQQFNLIKNSSP